MKIHIEYEPTPQELGNASALFVEKKPFLLLLVILSNILVGFVVISIAALFFLKLSLTLAQWISLGVGLLWLFGRPYFHKWLLHRRMKNSLVIGKPISIEMTLNGIVWSGKGLRPGAMQWEHIKYIIEVKNGYILPNSFTRFLWIPFRGFESPAFIDTFRKFIIEKRIVLKVYSKGRSNAKSAPMVCLKTAVPEKGSTTRIFSLPVKSYFSLLD